MIGEPPENPSLYRLLSQAHRSPQGFPARQDSAVVDNCPVRQTLNPPYTEHARSSKHRKPKWL
jgi:hypothetical protein